MQKKSEKMSQFSDPTLRMIGWTNGGTNITKVTGHFH